mmetsp:Transcript_30348/g.70922  ORF Transcript_30348/g.70922 Transcript_30348/m.70922 type:complete len:212 (+) Transcript_30348:395-1030(+)
MEGRRRRRRVVVVVVVVVEETMGKTAKSNNKKAAKAKSQCSSHNNKIKSSKGGKSAERTILEVLASFHANGKAPVEKDKVLKAANVAAKTMANNLPKLKRQEMIEVTGSLLSLTHKGIEEMGDLAKGAVCNEENLERLKKDLKTKQILLLEALLDKEVHSKNDIAQQLGFNDCKQKTFVNLMGSLSGKQIVHYPTKGKIQLNLETCFPFDN